jgi:hypothetical protein
MTDLEKDLLERIELIETDRYPVKRMTKRDYIAAGVFTLICLLLVIGGIWL